MVYFRFSSLYLFLSIFLFSGCESCREMKCEKATALSVRGNTILLKDGRSVVLIGVENTQQVEDFIARNISANVTLVYDSGCRPAASGNAGSREARRGRRKKTDSSTNIYAYLLDENGRSINGQILRNKVCGLNTVKLKDSLQIFKKYASEVNQVEQLDQGSTQNVVQRLRSSCFMVNTYDEDGNVRGIGSGFFIGNGLGVSNYHVFENGTSWSINSCLLEGDRNVTEIIANDPTKDYVVFRVNMEGQPHSTLAFCKKNTEQGDNVIVYGNPKGLACTLTRGYISALRQDENDTKYIQIDAAISPGSSGSPVVNNEGELIGIATFKRTDCENCNFALDINEVKYRK